MNSGLPAFSDDLVLTPVSRWPTTLLAETARTVLATPPAERIRQVGTRPERPHVSVIIVTHNGLLFSRLCLESLLTTAAGVEYEVIVVDNGSTDGTVEYLREIETLDPRVHVQRNRENAGFAAATNAGVARASGDVVVLLNNDTIVPERVLERAAARVADPDVGLLGAVTNRAGNEAEVETRYRTYGELHRFARDYTQAHAGEVFDIRTATMFFAAMRREVWRAVGPLDERFEVGLFEDDDYAMRARRLGYRVVCADDLFVHHFGQASIGQLGPTGQYGRIFHANRARWEAKWGTRWRPYARREKPGYRELSARIRALVSDRLPLDATVAVISKGDGGLLQLGRRTAWHFPQAEDGSYAGHYPADSAACIEEVERMRRCGARFLVVPTTARWWLQHYRAFGEHLQTRYESVVDDPSAVIFSLSNRASHERAS